MITYGDGHNLVAIDMIFFLQVFCEAFDVRLDRHIWIAILILPMVVLSWIRNLDELASLSMVANLCIGSALLIIVYAEINSFM